MGEFLILYLRVAVCLLFVAALLLANTPASSRRNLLREASSSAIIRTALLRCLLWPVTLTEIYFILLRVIRERKAKEAFFERRRREDE